MRRFIDRRTGSVRRLTFSRKQFFDCLLSIIFVLVPVAQMWGLAEETTLEMDSKPGVLLQTISAAGSTTLAQRRHSRTFAPPQLRGDGQIFSINLNSGTSSPAFNENLFFPFEYSGINSILSVPSVRFVGVRHYSRVSDLISVGVEASNTDPINRVELYLDGALISTNNVAPSNPNVFVNFSWNTAVFPNGKHMLEAKVYSVEGNVQSVFAVVLVHNITPTLPLPTATFTALPPTILSGQSSTLSWTTTNASTVSINQGVGAVALNGSTVVSPFVTMTYTLTASNATGTITRTATITVNTAQLPTATFTALPTSISAGQSATLSWATTNAETVTINQGIGSVALNGSTTVSPSVTTTYTLTASNAAGSFTKTATITVTPLQLPTATFTALPTSISAGQSSTLSWTTTNAASVTINQGVGGVALNGSTTVSPSVTTTYTLTASNAAGPFTTTATVTVTGPPTGNNITLNSAVRYQTMGGWEAASEAGQLYSPAWNNYKNSLLDQAVNDLGINRIRLEIKSGVENPVDYFAQWRAGQITEAVFNTRRYEIVNDNTNANVINPSGFKWSSLDHTINELVLPMRQRLAARGESLWINVNYVDFGSSPFEHKSTPAEYAEFVLATYQHMQSVYGFVPNSWEVILEPDTGSAAWSAAQIAQAIKAAGDLLAANGFTPNFVAPSVTNIANASSYIGQIASTSGAMAYVSEFAYHRYVGGTDTQLQTLANLATQYNKQTAMLEWIGASYLTLHQDLKVGQNSSWQQFTLAFPNAPDDGSQYYLVNDANPGNPVVTIGSRTKYFRQYFRYIRAGARRIEAQSGSSNLDPVAFINTNGKYVAVVKTETGISFTIQGLPAGNYGIKYTTASQYDINLADVSIATGQSLSTSIPALGVITVYAK